MEMTRTERDALLKYLANRLVSRDDTRRELGRRRSRALWDLWGKLLRWKEAEDG